MAIVGIGIDVVDVERFSRALSNAPGLKARLFVESEFDLPIKSLAARFAAKEAVAKVLGAPGGLKWHDVSIERYEYSNQPKLRVTGVIAERANSLGIVRWHISMSHDARIATAMVIAES
jgi:holo-[acyl-carrier protein] synthase